MENGRDRQTRAESKTRIVEQVNACLRSGTYSRALDLLRGAATEFPGDAELTALEKLAHDGIQRNAEAQRLITESQELFAQQKAAEAIQLLRKAYELDKNNSLARAILANALVEHAHSLVETDWLEAEKLAKQALDLNPSHPTANTIRDRILDWKKTSSVDQWVSQARKLQSSGDLFAALAWVAEGLAIHPDDPKLLQIHDAIQRDQVARRRQARRRDLEDLRRMEIEIDEAADAAAKKAFAERVQAMAAKYWTDGEILAIANRLLHRLGLASHASSTASPQSKGSTVIFHVPRASAPEPSRAAIREASADTTLPNPVPPNYVSPQDIPTTAIPPGKVPPGIVRATGVPVSEVRASVVSTTLPPPLLVPSAPPQTESSSTSPAKLDSRPSPAKEPARSNSTALIIVSAAAIALVAVTFFFTRRHYASSAAQNQSVAPTAAAPEQTTPTQQESTQATPEPSLPVSSAPSDTNTGRVTLNPPQLAAQPDAKAMEFQPGTTQPTTDRQPADTGHMGGLVVVVGQDNASVFLNGKVQPQLTQSGQLRIPNLEAQDYVVQVSKNGFQNPPQQAIRIRKGEQARLVFNLRPQPQPTLTPRLASLTIRGGVPGITVFVDQSLVGTIQPDGTLSVATINPGDHTVELRKERFKTREFKKHFVAGEAISLAPADTALEAAPGELKIAFTPADAKVAIVKGERLTMVSSGVPLNLAAGTYTLTARTSDGFRSSSTLEVVAGQSRTLSFSLTPNGMSRWDEPGAWKHEKDSFLRKGGNFVLYGVVPASGTFAFSAMPAKGHFLQWVLNYTDPRNYVLCQMDDNNFHRTVIRNGEKTGEISVPDKADKKSFRTLRIRVSPTEIVHQIRHGDSWTVLDRLTQPGADLSLGKFGFYIPGDDQIALSDFAHYPDLNLR